MEQLKYKLAYKLAIHYVLHAYVAIHYYREQCIIIGDHNMLQHTGGLRWKSIVEHFHTNGAKRI
jgi:hypothetical protein